MADEAEVEEELIDVLRETDLVKFQTMIVFDKQLTRIEHFQDVTDIELMSYGFSEPAVRRLRNAIDRKRKKRTKIFGATKREKTLVRLKRKPVEFGQNEAAFPSTPHLISENEILFKETLGEGHFSVVKRALWARTDGAKMDCAVKILHEMSPAIRLDLTSEISTMQRLRHQNLVQLFGVIFSEQIMMVIELCEDGSLLDRLRSQTKPRILVTTLLNYAQQIANGMGFLESRKCLHRDLATRNILLTHQEQVVKIGDFGLTRILKDNEHLYIMSEPKKIPFSWSPPESLRFREFSHKSDVWAFGVTLWELFSFGEEPWAGHRAAEVLQLIEAGHRLRMLDFCSQEIYDIMKLCWNGEAEKRPKFSHLRTLLNDCKFMTVICRVQNVATSKSQLNLSVGDELFVIGQRDNADIWYGQSAKSRNFGDFPREKVSMRSATYPQTTKNATNSPEQQKDISRPVAGSFIHTGHGDIREHKCWGHVDHIDDIYLRNPLITQNPGANSEQKVTIVPSLLMLDQKWCALSHENGVAEHLQHSDEFIDNQRLTVDQKLTDGQIFDGYDANLSIGSRNNTAGLTTNELNLQRHSTAIEWLSDGLTMSREIEPIQTQKNREQTNRQRPFALPQQKSWERNGERNETATIAKSKYDSAISIPRPNRFSNIRLTPPPISSAHFSVCRSDGCPQTVTTIFEPKMTAVSSMPSVNSPFFNNKTAPTNTKDVQMVTKVQRPNSAHSLNTEEKTQKAMRSSDDPFMVKDDVKVLASKLRYNDVHKANEFFTIGQSETNLWDERTAKESSKSNEETQKHSRSNVAIVQPFLNNQSGIEAAKGQCPPIGAVLSQHSNLTKTVESLLPPPSDLLLSGLGTSSHIRPFDPLQCQPLFDISGYLSACQGPCIRYGTNGIPILEPAPAPMSANVDLLKCQTNGRQGKAKAEQKETVAISLNELDTDALIRRVKVSADFASFEQCRQILWRKGFDVDAAIKQLKIDKLIEMGLASDRHLAVSALDSEQWDVNAAANRLCCP